MSYLSKRLAVLVNKTDSINWLKLLRLYWIAALAVPIGIYFFIAAYKSTKTDFFAFYTGAKLLATNAKMLYDPASQIKVQNDEFGLSYKLDTGYMAYINIPISAFIYIPYLLINANTAAYVSFFVSIVLTFAGIYLLYRNKKARFFSLTSFLVISFVPIYQSIHLAQIASVIFLIVVGIYLNFLKGNTKAVAVLCALLILKYQYLLLVPYLFLAIKDKKTFLKWFLPTFFTLAALNFVVAPATWVEQYINLMAVYMNNHTVMGMENKFSLNMYSALGHLTGDATLTTYLLSGVIYLASMLLVTAFRKRVTNTKLLFYAVLIFAMVFNLHTLPSDYIFLLIPLIGLIESKESWVVKSLVVVTIYLSSFYSVFSATWLQTILLMGFGLFLLVKQAFLVGDPGLEPGTARV